MLKFIPTKRSILSHESDCLLLCVATDAAGKPVFSATTKEADKALAGLIGEVCRRGDFRGKTGEILWLHARDFAAARVLLTGIGGNDEDARAGLDAAFAAAAAVDGIKTMTAALADLPPMLVDFALVAAGRACYRYRQGGHLPGDGAPLRRLSFSPPPRFAADRLALAAATAEGAQLTLHLAEQPGNVCTPAFLAAVAATLEKKTTLRARAMDEKEMKKRRMGALLAVAQGGKNRPRLIVLEHRGGKKGSAPVALVGKGVTFDTGGISIKPAAAMDEMKFDMCGAATVFGVMLACARAKLPLNVVGIAPACENMPDGGAFKPGDVVTAMSGKTIETLNTDAEGRLILADALTYADQFNPAEVIDVATLTGACVIALGSHVSGLMGRGEKLLADLRKAGDDSGDPCWRLPLGEKYQRQLKTDYADVANIGGRAAGTITAACFLSRFVNCENWAHLDIAGTAWTDKKRATGRPTALLMRHLAARAAATPPDSAAARRAS